MSDSRTVEVKLNTSRVGHRTDKNGKMCGMFSQQVGSVVLMDKDEAKRYVNNGAAEYVKSQQ